MSAISSPTASVMEADGLRERSRGHKIDTSPDVKKEDKPPKEKKTFGRTPDGAVFTVPQTHDMVSQLLDPRQPKNLSDIIVLAILGLHILALYILPASLRKPMFAFVFLFWRVSYNIGIGYLLRIQSNHKKLVAWAKRYQIFEKPLKNPRPWLYKLIKRELESKIREDYKIEEAPIEYNTWLVFRRLVDLILMCDFMSYGLFAIACSKYPVGEGLPMFIARLAGGIILIGFNLWVKLDAHRVVKDYAWYWGDFFFLIDADLTFDGVFEIAPHPMYSIGYAGYYGISMLAASYSVLFISLVAHGAQFLFLVWVERPHIEKTYNSPAPRKRQDNHASSNSEHENDEVASKSSFSSSQPPAVHNLMGIKNIDLFRITDVSTIIIQLYVLIFTALTSCTPTFQVLFVLHAAVWRLWFSVGLGSILRRQSDRMTWTRHFIKFGEGADEAWRQWKGMYHLSTMLCYSSFIAATWKMYSFPSNWTYGLVLLNHIVGIGLIALQIWTAVNIYDSLSEFGWYYGDFFFEPPKLTYSGIYRYLNNPERIIGLAGIWGAVFLTESKAIFCLALFSHLLALGFIEYCERPHMAKLYGKALRPEAGITKGIKRSLPKKLHSSVEDVLCVAGHFVVMLLEAFVRALTIIRDFFSRNPQNRSALLSKYPAHITITRLAHDLTSINPADYSIRIIDSQLASTSNSMNGNRGMQASEPTDGRGYACKPVFFDYGAPIQVQWKAPLKHSNQDWVGLYKVSDNSFQEITRISSAGRWVATVPNEYESSPSDQGMLTSNEPTSTGDYVQGSIVFEGDKLFWTQGIFEFRYHHDGKHNVLAISPPFEIRVRPSYAEDIKNIEHSVLPVVRNCFDRNPDIVPNTVDENFGYSVVERDEKYAKRVAYAIDQTFGIEFAPEVVLADGNVRSLAKRVFDAKRVLAPYSISHPKGTTTLKD